MNDNGVTTMRLMAQIVSIFGGLLGLFSALGVLAFGEGALVGDAGSRGDARLLGFIALVIALIGIVGGIAISERSELALPLLLLTAGAGFVPLGWGWTVCGLGLASGALLTILSDPDRRPASRRVAQPPTPLRRWAVETFLRPQQRLGFGGGIAYVVVVSGLVYGAVALLSNVAGIVD
jgi:hypothetical protein